MKNKNKKIVAIFLIVLLMTNAIAIFSNQEVKGETKSGYTSHSPILIDGNENFTYGNGVVSGDGSQGNPYIIEGWDIDASGQDGIRIENTDKFFIIRNCFTHGGEKGIYFYYVKNGKIANSKFTDNTYGVYLYQSLNNTITNNNLSYNKNRGMWLFSSSNNNITYNLFSNNTWYGVVLYDSPRNTIIHNNVSSNNYYGIYVDSSSNNKIYLNNIINNTIQAYDNSNNYWDYNGKGNYWSDYDPWVRELDNIDTITVSSYPSMQTYSYYVKENALESYVNLTSLSNNSGEDLDLTVYDPKGNTAGISAGPNAEEQVHLKKKDMQRGGSGEWEIEIQAFNGTIIKYQITVDVLYNKTLIVDSNNDGIGDTPYYIQGGKNKDNFPLMKPNPNAGIQNQNPSSEPKNEFPILYIILGVIIIIIVAILLSLFFIKRNKLKSQIPMQFQYQQPYLYQQQIPQQTQYPYIQQQLYQPIPQNIVCPNCHSSFQVSSQIRQCPYCGLRYKLK